MNGLGIL